MGVNRGYGSVILRDILGVDIGTKTEAEDFWSYAASCGVEAGTIICVQRIMARHRDEDDVLAAVWCAILSYLWSGHASFYAGDLPEIFSSWTASCAARTGHEALRERITAQAMKQCFDERGSSYICRRPEDAGDAILYEDAERGVYATPRMTRLIRDVSSNLKRYFADYDDEIAVSRSTVEARVCEKSRALKPHVDQTEAVLSFCRRHLTVVVGGPGTGKTSMVVCQILRIAFEDWKIAPQDILLAAPTGKAAQRMQAAIRGVSSHLQDDLREKFDGLKAQTIHRILSLRSGLLSPYACGEKLHAKLVIVDEVSMIELPLAALLLGAIDPASTRLVLVGDPNQLPPVGTGEILSNFSHCDDTASRDDAERAFCQGMKDCTKALSKNYRAKDAPDIVRWQEAIIAGQESALSVASKPVESIRFSGVEYCDDFSNENQTIDTAIGRWVETMRECYAQTGTGVPHETLDEAIHTLGDYDRDRDKCVLSRVFDFFDNGFRILTPVNTGKCGVKALNERVCAKLGLSGECDFPNGCLVMLMHNNYGIGHFNGDTGIVLEMAGEANHRARYVAFPKADENGQTSFDYFPVDRVAPMLQKAFAITIHKSQGSEYRRGLILLPTQKTPLLSRNLLYTAVSRTRESVALISTRERLADCVNGARRFDPGLPFVRS